MLEKRDDKQQESKGHLLFDAGSRVNRIRFAVVVSLAFPALVAFLVFRMPNEQLILDFGSMAGGRIFQLGLVAFSGVFVYVMMWFSGKYLLKIVLENDLVVLITWRMWLPNKTYSFHRSFFVRSPVLTERERFGPFPPLVNAPYYTVRVEGKKLILDAKGSFPEGKEVVLELMGSDN